MTLSDYVSVSFFVYVSVSLSLCCNLCVLLCVLYVFYVFTCVGLYV